MIVPISKPESIMRKMVCVLILLSFFVSPLFAQWESEKRLIFKHGASYYTTQNYARCVAAGSHHDVHVVCIGDGIYYKRSTDSGLSWYPVVHLTSPQSGVGWPSICVSGSVVHLVWVDARDGRNEEIYYKRSTDSGATWSQDTRLTKDTSVSQTPSLCASGKIVHLVWEENRDHSYWVFYKRSTNNGASLSSEVRLTNVPACLWNTSIAASGAGVHIVWYDMRNKNAEIYYKHSTDRGVTWSPDIRLTADSAYSWSPCVASEGSDVHVVWMDNRCKSADEFDINHEIFYKHSEDGGITWSPDTRLTVKNSRFPWSRPYGWSQSPSLAVSGEYIHLIWTEDQVFYKLSTNAGKTWCNDWKIVDGRRPHDCSIAVSGTVLHAVWWDNLVDDARIYYIRNPDGNVKVR